MSIADAVIGRGRSTVRSTPLSFRAASRAGSACKAAAPKRRCRAGRIDHPSTCCPWSLARRSHRSDTRISSREPEKWRRRTAMSPPSLSRQSRLSPARVGLPRTVRQLEPPPEAAAASKRRCRDRRSAPAPRAGSAPPARIRLPRRRDRSAQDGAAERQTRASHPRFWYGFQRRARHDQRAGRRCYCSSRTPKTRTRARPERARIRYSAGSACGCSCRTLSLRIFKVSCILLGACLLPLILR
jgi:hypothetical protein